MHCTKFPNVFASKDWTEEITTWPGLVERLSQFETRPTYSDECKRSLPLWAPIRLKPSTSRKAINVLEVHAVALDLDDSDEDGLAAVLERLVNDGLSFLCHSTLGHLHDGLVWKVRIVIPLASPVMGRAWVPLWKQIATHYAPGTDRHCKDPSRQYYVPAVVEGQDPLLLVNDGKPLDPGMLANEIRSPLMAETRISDRALKNMVAKWGRSTDPVQVKLAERFSSVLAGESFANPGERDVTLFEMCGALVRSVPSIDPESVQELFRLSIDRMAVGADEPLTLDDVAAKIKSWQGHLAAMSTATEVSAYVRESELIRQAFGTDRDTPYTEGELQTMASVLGVKSNQLNHCWVLQHLSDYYVLAPGMTYTFAKRESLINACRVELAPSPVDMWTESKDGERMLSVSEILEKHSTPLRDVHRSLSDQSPRFEVKSKILTLPTCPQRDVLPAYSDEIDGWLRVLGGDQYDILCDWLALFPDLTSPISGLVLIGEGGGGKSLLIQGLSRIWTTGGATPLDQALGNFNACLETCPLAVADETLPRDSRGRVRSDEIREFIQATRRKSNEKYRVSSTLIGAARLIVAANNDQLLDFRDGLSQADIGAIAERLFHLEVTTQAKRYLESIGGRSYIQANWVDSDALTAHVLWLEANRETAAGGRFGTNHDSKLFSDKLAIRERSRAGICEWLVKWAFAPDRLAATGISLEVVDSVILIHVGTLLDQWGIYVKNANVPTTASAAAALKALSVGSLKDDSGLSLQAVDPAMLGAWAEQHGYCDPVVLKEKLSALG